MRRAPRGETPGEPFREISMVVVKSRNKILPVQMDTLVYWIKARETLRINKATNRPAPWSDDPLLTDYRWCNVRRMDDRVSIWLLNWHKASPDTNFRDRIVAAVAGRLINWPDTLAEVPYPDPFRSDIWTKRILERKARGEKVFTGAYIINGALGGDKIIQVTEKVLSPLWKKRGLLPEAPTTLSSVYRALDGQAGIGSFMAGQAVADLRHIHPDMGWTDVHSWAPRGPGSQRGVNRLIGAPLDKSRAYDEWLDIVRLGYAQARSHLPLIFRRLELMDFQNCLCEYDKYSRLKNGEGSVRSRYRSQS